MVWQMPYKQKKHAGIVSALRAKKLLAPMGEFCHGHKRLHFRLQGRLSLLVNICLIVITGEGQAKVTDVTLFTCYVSLILRNAKREA